MTNEAATRAEMPAGTSAVLDNRNLQNDYPALLKFLTKGLYVLDVGCGTGAITKGIANVVGSDGFVIGIDSSAHLIAKGKIDCRNIKNLELIDADLFNYCPNMAFDVIVSARVFQWLTEPKKALLKCKELLKSNGTLSILDYNHTKLKWNPEPPQSMKKFYQAFLDWRTDAGMNNIIAEDLPRYFEELGFKEIEVSPADEVYKKGENNFIDEARIWSMVAKLRGPQMVQSGFISEDERLQAMKEYDTWTENEAELMIMNLKEIRGKK